MMKPVFDKHISELYPSASITRRAPANLSGGSSAFLKEVNPEFKPVSLYSYTNVNVTPEGHVFRGLKIDPDLLIYPAHHKIYNWLYLASTLVKRKKITLPPGENYLMCVDYWSNSIFHWMCDALPRLEAVKELAKDCVLLLPEFYTFPYILETLKAFQFKDIYLLSDATYVHCQKLYVPEQVTLSGQIRPENILSLRRSLLDYFKPRFSGTIQCSNVYVSRSKAKYRKVINEAELLPILGKHGFKLIYFEDLSVSEQIELCYQARNIVSIHGANLTNVIFMQEGGKVLELRKKGDIYNNYFYELADSVHCDYYHLDCDFEDPEPQKNTFSLYADVQQFDRALKKMTNAG